MKTVSTVSLVSGSPVKTASAPTSLVSSSPVKTASAPTSLVSSSPVKTVSAPTSLVGSSPVKTASAPTSLVSSSPVKTVSAPTSLAGGSSSSVTATSSGGAHINRALGQKVAQAAGSATPLVGGVVVGAVAAGFLGVANTVKYAKNEKSGKQAARDTVAGSAGLGVSAGLGIAAAKAVAGTSLGLGTAVIVPLAAGVATIYVSMRIWHRIFFKAKSASKAK